MQHFLLIYDHSRQELRASPEVFRENECEQATAAYQAAEREYRREDQVEIVLIGSDSLETIRRTHGHYFDHSDRLARYLTTA